MLINRGYFVVNNNSQGFSLKAKSAQNPFFLTQDDYYEELASLVEILKVEGWWNNTGRISITNKSPELLVLFDDLFRIHGIKPAWASIVKVKIPSGVSKDQGLKVFRNGQERSFHFGRNGFGSVINFADSLH